jgi:hypothetical protein
MRSSRPPWGPFEVEYNADTISFICKTLLTPEAALHLLDRQRESYYAEMSGYITAAFNNGNGPRSSWETALRNFPLHFVHDNSVYACSGIRTIQSDTVLERYSLTLGSRGLVKSEETPLKLQKSVTGKWQAQGQDIVLRRESGTDTVSIIEDISRAKNGLTVNFNDGEVGVVLNTIKGVPKDDLETLQHAIQHAMVFVECE